MTIKDHIKGTVDFQYYRAGNLYYVTETGITFPVPIEDTGEATFLSSDKAILFMRYIRKHLKFLEDSK
jgi:hypothetical protein